MQTHPYRYSVSLESSELTVKETLRVYDNFLVISHLVT
jgi:hypothetical protein